MGTETVHVLTKTISTWDEEGHSSFSDLIFASKSKGVVEEILNGLVDEGSDENYIVEYEIEELLLI